MIEPVTDPTEAQLASWHRTFGPLAYNHTWTLLDKDELTREEEAEMLASTFAQRYHWYQVGTSRHQAIADWQVSRVTAVLGYAEMARRFGEHSLQICRANELDAFVTGFAHEAIARAAADVDDVQTFTEHLEVAKELLIEIEDADERDLLSADLTEMSEE